ncbi:unnamed protein product, partial [Choristocarpus tenellus]
MVVEGAAAQRQLSRSLFVPRSLEGYERHMRDILCEGYLERKGRTSDTWHMRWFLLKDETLSYFKDRNEAYGHRTQVSGPLHNPKTQNLLALDEVEAVRTE